MMPSVFKFDSLNPNSRFSTSLVWRWFLSLFFTNHLQGGWNRRATVLEFREHNTQRRSRWIRYSIGALTNQDIFDSVGRLAGAKKPQTLVIFPRVEGRGDGAEGNLPKAFLLTFKCSPRNEKKDTRSSTAASIHRSKGSFINIFDMLLAALHRRRNRARSFHPGLP